MNRKEEEALRSSALKTAASVLQARDKAEAELRRAKETLEKRTGELAESLAIMKATLESTTDGIVAVDSEGVITHYNERFAEMWGMSREMMRTLTREQLFEHACSRVKNGEEFRAATARIYAEAPPETSDVVEFTDGRVVERVSRVQRVEKRVTGRVWSYRDITARIRIEQTLRDEQRVLQLLNNTGSAIAAQLELEAVVQIVTDAATELTGAKFGAFFYKITDEKGESLLLYSLSGAPKEAFDRFGHPRATALFGPTFRGEAPIRVDDVTKDSRYGTMGPHFGMPKGHLPVRSYLAAPVTSRAGDVIGGLFFGHPEPGVFSERSERIVVGVAAQAAIAIDNARLYDAAQREIRQRKAAEAERERLLVSEKEARERAERETRMKDEFLATLSHELRTPLNAILGWANIVRTTENRSEIAEGLEVIERNARLQAQIIEDLLDMSRIVSGNVRLDVQRVDLVPVIRAAMEAVQPTAAAREIRLSSVLDPLAGPIAGDPARLQQILWNLLTNALKFTPKGGRVHVLLERVDSHLEISVNDTGEGIAPEFLPHVFDRFRQADASTTRRQRGLGLGLAIVKNLAELHGGSVLARSPGPGQGSTFTLVLPAGPGAARDRPRASPSRRRDRPFGGGESRSHRYPCPRGRR